MIDKYKYPRTPHLSWSPGSTNDDKVVKSLSQFVGREIVLTEKLDGECSTLYPDYYHARSLDSKDHPSRHWLKGLWASIKHEIPTGYRICGENVYAKHSIEYEALESYFYVFSVWDEHNKCLSWEDTKIFANALKLITVPELFKGTFNLEFISDFHEKLDLSVQEGFVLRSADGFDYEDFENNMAKWVRKNHVQTDAHWMHSKVIPNKLKTNV